jgi:hypothetical protein
MVIQHGHAAEPADSQVLRIAAQLTAVPKLEGIGRALFIQPHPDDNQIGAGGIMAALVADGTQVYELTVCDDRYANPAYIGTENDLLDGTTKRGARRTASPRRTERRVPRLRQTRRMQPSTKYRMRFSR